MPEMRLKKRRLLMYSRRLVLEGLPEDQVMLDIANRKYELLELSLLGENISLCFRF